MASARRLIAVMHTDHTCPLEEHFQQLSRFIPLPAYLYMHRCSRLNYRTSSMRCRAYHQETFIQRTLLVSVDYKCAHQASTTTKVVNATAYSSASAQSCMRTTMANGHKFSAVRRQRQRLLDRSKIAIFSYPTCIWRNFKIS